MYLLIKLDKYLKIENKNKLLKTNKINNFQTMFKLKFLIVIKIYKLYIFILLVITYNIINISFLKLFN